MVLHGEDFFLRDRSDGGAILFRRASRLYVTCRIHILSCCTARSGCGYIWTRWWHSCSWRHACRYEDERMKSCCIVYTCGCNMLFIIFIEKTWESNRFFGYCWCFVFASVPLCS